MLLLVLEVVPFVIVVWLLSSRYAPTARVSPSSEMLSLLKRSAALLFEAFMYASCAHSGADSVVNPVEVSYCMLKLFPVVSLTPVVTLVL